MHILLIPYKGKCSISVNRLVSKEYYGDISQTPTLVNECNLYKYVHVLCESTSLHIDSYANDTSLLLEAK